MGFKFIVRDNAGSDLVPIADGSYYTISTELKNDELQFQSGDFVLAFYDADGTTVVTPSGGIITPLMSPIAGQWMSPGVGDTVIAATDVIAGIAVYTIPVFVGGAIQGRVDLLGIAGATYMRAEFRRFR